MALKLLDERANLLKVGALDADVERLSIGTLAPIEFGSEGRDWTCTVMARFSFRLFGGLVGCLGAAEI